MAVYVQRPAAIAPVQSGRLAGARACWPGVVLRPGPSGGCRLLGGTGTRRANGGTNHPCTWHLALGSCYCAHVTPHQHLTHSGLAAGRCRWMAVLSVGYRIGWHLDLGFLPADVPLPRNAVHASLLSHVVAVFLELGHGILQYPVLVHPPYDVSPSVHHCTFTDTAVGLDVGWWPGGLAASGRQGCCCTRDVAVESGGHCCSHALSS